MKATLLTGTVGVVVSAAANQVVPEMDVPQVVSIITQIAIGIITLWKLIKGESVSTEKKRKK